jgi:hypothetical protein
VTLALELAAGWILVSALAFGVGVCVVRLLGMDGPGGPGASQTASGHLANQPQAPGTR